MSAAARIVDTVRQHDPRQLPDSVLALTAAILTRTAPLPRPRCGKLGTAGMPCIRPEGHTHKCRFGGPPIVAGPRCGRLMTNGRVCNQRLGHPGWCFHSKERR